MRLLLFFYLVVTFFVSGFLIYDGFVWGGTALLLGTLIAFAGGSGARSCLYLGLKRRAWVLGGILFFAGMSLPYSADAIVRLAGATIAGDTWAALGFALGFFAARPDDLTPEEKARTLGSGLRA